MQLFQNDDGMQQQRAGVRGETHAIALGQKFQHVLRQEAFMPAPVCLPMQIANTYVCWHAFVAASTSWDHCAHSEKCSLTDRSALGSAADLQNFVHHNQN